MTSSVVRSNRIQSFVAPFPSQFWIKMLNTNELLKVNQTTQETTEGKETIKSKETTKCKLTQRNGRSDTKTTAKTYVPITVLSSLLIYTLRQFNEEVWKQTNEKNKSKRHLLNHNMKSALNERQNIWRAVNFGSIFVNTRTHHRIKRSHGVVYKLRCCSEAKCFVLRSFALTETLAETDANQAVWVVWLIRMGHISKSLWVCVNL